MLLVLGLGNPGPRFEHTRHNAGFDVVHRAATRLDVRLRKPFFKTYLIAHTEHLVLVTPLTYMNRSGDVLPGLIRRYDLLPENILVVCDNMDLDPGSIRLKMRGRSRAHNGIGSVMDALGTGDFPRLYVGVGRPRHSADVVEHVLAVPSESEMERYRDAIDRAAEAVLSLQDSSLEMVGSSLGPG
jgi:PTH1 family peptidyl-tRNA hydrolase